MKTIKKSVKENTKISYLLTKKKKNSKDIYIKKTKLQFLVIVDE